MAPMNAIHLVRSKQDSIISSDKTYGKQSDRTKLEEKVEK